METFLIVCLWVFAAWVTFGIFGGIAMIGKERKPWTAGQAIFSLIVNGFFVTILIVSTFAIAR